MDLPGVSLKLKDYGILSIEESLYLVATFDLQGQAQLVSILLPQLQIKFDLPSAWVSESRKHVITID